MNHVKFGFEAVLLAAVLLISADTVKVFSAESEWSSILQSNVTKRDSQGRVEVMEVHAISGTCIAQITYDETPRVYIVVASRTRLQNLGYLQINDGTENGLSDTVLMRIFNKAIREFCLPLIDQGYVLL
jgi:hypothetical protein